MSTPAERRFEKYIEGAGFKAPLSAFAGQSVVVDTASWFASTPQGKPADIPISLIIPTVFFRVVRLLASGIRPIVYLHTTSGQGIPWNPSTDSEARIPIERMLRWQTLGKFLPDWEDLYDQARHLPLPEIKRGMTRANEAWEDDKRNYGKCTAISLWYHVLERLAKCKWRGEIEGTEERSSLPAHPDTTLPAGHSLAQEVSFLSQTLLDASSDALLQQMCDNYSASSTNPLQIDPISSLPGILKRLGVSCYTEAHDVNGTGAARLAAHLDLPLLSVHLSILSHPGVNVLIHHGFSRTDDPFLCTIYFKDDVFHTLGYDKTMPELLLLLWHFLHDPQMAHSSDALFGIINSFRSGMWGPWNEGRAFAAFHTWYVEGISLPGSPQLLLKRKLATCQVGADFPGAAVFTQRLRASQEPINLRNLRRPLACSSDQLARGLSGRVLLHDKTLQFLAHRLAHLRESDEKET